MISHIKGGMQAKVFENSIPRRIFGPKSDANGERRFYNKELHSLYGSPYTIKMIKSRRIIWASHVARIEEGTNVFTILTGKPIGKRPLEYLGVDGRAILEWTMKK